MGDAVASPALRAGDSEAQSVSDSRRRSRRRLGLWKWSPQSRRSRI